MKISVRKVDGVLYPVGEQAQEDFKKLKGEVVISVTLHRNPAFHRKAFALLNMIYDNQDCFTNRDLFRSWITMKAGYVTTGTTPNGGTVFMPESLAFESMPQERFESWYSHVIDVAIDEYGMDRQALHQILGFV